MSRPQGIPRQRAGTAEHIDSCKLALIALAPRPKVGLKAFLPKHIDVPHWLCFVDLKTSDRPPELHSGKPPRSTRRTRGQGGEARNLPIGIVVSVSAHPWRDSLL